MRHKTTNVPKDDHQAFLLVPRDQEPETLRDPARTERDPDTCPPTLRSER